ncbi:uncharacterized protein AB675_1883 [Cyphellophora attinorum]|uniref:Uncharacterized protein n=1 Tax=Cyphellophora attinorum TaxID=1664694 RepID=A0A0N0NPL7_9EURO|nr:uncharacterized protein AB675_1883 [Phialophora attinorum]KPI42868.1 hypothetical protein AB675_1883 [Phialophora attinorum]
MSNDDDVVRNQLALQYAQYETFSKTLRSSGVEGASDSESSNDDQHLVKHAQPKSSEVSGIGAVLPTGDDDYGNEMLSRQETAATQRLRKQILGDRVIPPAGSLSATGSMIQGGGHSAAPKPRSRPATKQDSDDEEEGRGKLGKSKSKSKGVGVDSSVPDLVTSDADNSGTAQQTGTSSPQPVSKKRGTSYLDQLLANRANKKSKKKQKQKQESAG